MAGDIDGSGFESFPDIRGNEDFMAGYNVSFVYVFSELFICFFQAGYIEAERDCRSRQSGDFDAGSTISDGRKVYKWCREIFKGSRYEESK